MPSTTRDESLRNILAALRDKEIVPRAFRDQAQQVRSAWSRATIANALKSSDEDVLAAFVTHKGVLKATLVKLDQEQLQTQLENMLHERRRN